MKAYRCFCTSERLQQIRYVAQKSGKGVVYDRHCLYLSQEEIDQKLSERIPFTVRLKVISHFFLETKKNFSFEIYNYALY